MTPPTRPLEGRIALVTGATRGIGRSAALALARAGARLILTARTKAALEEVDDEVKQVGSSATLVPLNLTHGDKVDALGPGLYERFGQLDIFIANAGILGTLSPLPHVKSDDWQRVMSLNVDANFRLLRTLDPLLRKSDAARVVLVSSSAAWKCKAYWGPYSVSKAAVDALMKTYANEVANTAIRVNSLDPGATRTSMRAKAMPGEDPQTVALPQSLDDVFIALASRECTHNGEVVVAQQHPAYRKLLTAPA